MLNSVDAKTQPDNNTLLPRLIRAFRSATKTPLTLSQQALYNSWIFHTLTQHTDTATHLALRGDNPAQAERAHAMAMQALDTSSAHPYTQLSWAQQKELVDEQVALLGDFAGRITARGDDIPAPIRSLITVAPHFNMEHALRRAAKAIPASPESPRRPAFTAPVDIHVDAHICAHLMDAVGMRLKQHWGLADQSVQYRAYARMLRDRLPAIADPQDTDKNAHMGRAFETLRKMRARAYVAVESPAIGGLPRDALAERRLATEVIRYTTPYSDLYTSLDIDDGEEDVRPTPAPSSSPVTSLAAWRGRHHG